MDKFPEKQKTYNATTGTRRNKTYIDQSALKELQG